MNVDMSQLQSAGCGCPRATPRPVPSAPSPAKMPPPVAHGQRDLWLATHRLPTGNTTRTYLLENLGHADVGLAPSTGGCSIDHDKADVNAAQTSGSASLFRALADAEVLVPGIDLRAVGEQIYMADVLELIGLEPGTQHWTKSREAVVRSIAHKRPGAARPPSIRGRRYIAASIAAQQAITWTYRRRCRSKA